MYKSATSLGQSGEHQQFQIADSPCIKVRKFKARVCAKQIDSKIGEFSVFFSANQKEFGLHQAADRGTVAATHIKRTDLVGGPTEVVTGRQMH
ncbi:hypothetical protein bcgnr5380_56380 [Bacillus cereus]|uniref:Uncharacterized protein n=1 Tax=Lysobacter enzymogenes TaxID=69 RepID=A0AAU9AB15_LYSEN|nr:hypothetical protein LEN_0250 [Lysobacter enzymogenes]